MNGLYRVIGKKKASKTYMHEFALEFLKAKLKGRSGLMVWTNTFLAEPWEEEADRIEATPLLARREDYGPELTQEALLVTCGVDIQGNRWEALVSAWGEHEQYWGVEYKVHHGNPESPDFWAELDLFLLKRYKRVDGRELKIDAACVDMGGFADQTRSFTKAREARRVFAIKGFSRQSDPVVISVSRRNRMRCPVYNLNVDEAKATLMWRLRLDEPGNGYLHFTRRPEAGFDEVFFSGLTAEECVVRHIKGVTSRHWEKTKARNEPLDTWVYSLAALRIIVPNWERLKRTRNYHLRAENDENAAKTSEKPEETQEQPIVDKPQQTRHKGRRIMSAKRRWSTSWR